MGSENNDYGELYVPEAVSFADLVQAYADSYVKSYEEQFERGECTREQRERACAAVNALVGREFGGLLADQAADTKRTDGGKTLWSVPCPEGGRIAVESWGNDCLDYAGVRVAYQAETGGRTTLAICEKETEGFARDSGSPIAVFTCDGVSEEPVRTDFALDGPLASAELSDSPSEGRNKTGRGNPAFFDSLAWARFDEGHDTTAGDAKDVPTNQGSLDDDPRS